MDVLLCDPKPVVNGDEPVDIDEDDDVHLLCPGRVLHNSVNIISDRDRGEAPPRAAEVFDRLLSTQNAVPRNVLHEGKREHVRVVLASVDVLLAPKLGGPRGLRVDGLEGRAQPGNADVLSREEGVRRKDPE